jgi:glutamate racemase
MIPFPTVAVFDSGIGGVSILQALRARLPGVQYIYACDSEGFPYGTKTEAQVIQLATSFVQRLIARFPETSLLVVACNTASTLVLDLLRSQLKIPIVGVVPALKPAAQMTRTATFGLLATPATIMRPYTKNLIDQYARGRRVLLHGTSELVRLAEIKLRGVWDPMLQEIVRQELEPLFTQSPLESFKKMDTVVLGCTHFPHLIEELKMASPWPVQWVDSGQAVAARVSVVLEEALFTLESLTARAKDQLVWYEPGLRDSSQRLPHQLVQEFASIVNSIA